MNKPRLLWCGDACCATGFARATHKTLETLQETWDVTVLGIGANGDPHDHAYTVYPAFSGGDAFGVGRIAALARHIDPDVIVIQNDPWNVPPFIDELVDDDAPVVGLIAVDGRNCPGVALNQLDHAIFWTAFAETEAKLGGYTGSSSVIPLGVDLEVYHPLNRAETRAELEVASGALPLADAFIVGNVNRNQPRKRLDLTIAYFAEWVHAQNITDAYLFLHVCPTGERGCDVRQLVRYHGIQKRVILAEPGAGHGVPEAQLVRTYNMFDIMLTTTQGEGFGLPTLEGMACGIPQVVPNWSALGTVDGWTGTDNETVIHVPCASTSITPNGVNVIGGVPDRQSTITALNDLYRSPELRAQLSERSYRLAAQPRFRWTTIGERVNEVLRSVAKIPEPALT